MWLVISNSGDSSALWAWAGLQKRGLTPIELITTESLMTSLRWVHCLGEEGVSTRFQLMDGRHFDADEVQGTLNRMLYVPVENLLLIQPADRPYVAQELTSLFLSWLYSMPGPMVNRPTPQGLCGHWRHISEWVCLAARAGLPTLSYRQSANDTNLGLNSLTSLSPPGWPIQSAILFNGSVFGAAFPLDIQAGCLRLLQAAGTELLGIEFARMPSGKWVFTGANVYPDLRLGGEALLDVLANVLCNTVRVTP
jgi:hypothetical protein